MVRQHEERSCNDGCKELTELRGNMNAGLAEVHKDLSVALSGVSNFREFQLENREFMGWFRAKEEERTQLDKRRSRIHYWWLALLSGLIITLFVYTLEHHSFFIK